jgi:hypothetical protein
VPAIGIAEYKVMKVALKPHPFASTKVLL